MISLLRTLTILAIFLSLLSCDQSDRQNQDGSTQNTDQYLVPDSHEELAEEIIKKLDGLLDEVSKIENNDTAQIAGLRIVALGDQLPFIQSKLEKLPRLKDEKKREKLIQEINATKDRVERLLAIEMDIRSRFMGVKNTLFVWECIEGYKENLIALAPVVREKLSNSQMAPAPAKGYIADDDAGFRPLVPAAEEL